MLLGLLFALAIVTISIVICIREIYIIYYNPSPKFNDVEKDINDVQFVKTRTIKEINYVFAEIQNK